jgi:hypothetical protein
MKKLFCVCVVALFAFPALGQGRTEKSHTVTIYPLGAEYGFETPIGAKWTLKPHVGVNALLGWSSNMLVIQDDAPTLNKPELGLSDSEK